ncbi:MAG: DUF4230 domain-containing protein [Kiritimatiellaeota bacterium]|nr:DUF4230 domain-containing protein [Kiritimatiellota bacterium]
MTDLQPPPPVPPPALPPERESLWGRVMKLSESLKFALFIIVGCLLVVVVTPVFRFTNALFDWNHIENATLAILKSENLAFLVTDRKTSQIEVSITDNSPLLGKREGHLIGPVTLYYGIDVQALDRSCLSHTADRMIVRLPEPRELDFTMDPGAFRYVTKRSGWNVVRDFVLNKNLETELRQQVHQQALAFFAEKKLIPTREKIVNQLNNLAAPFSKELGVPIEFQ